MPGIGDDRAIIGDYDSSGVLIDVVLEREVRAHLSTGITGSATGKFRHKTNLPALQQRPALRAIDGDESACFRDDRWRSLYTAITRGMKRVVMVRL